MTNYEYIKTLSQDEMIQFIVKEMSMVFEDVIDESTRAWKNWDSVESRIWKKWLNEQHEESSS